jgi:tetratricopeptide (TPR) repeat protein
MYCNSRKGKPMILVIGLVLTVAMSAHAQNITRNSQRVAPVIFLDSTKEQDGLIGPVRRVQTETVKLETKSGIVTEGKRELLEVTTYNLRGERVENASYPIGGTPGKEEYKYDEKGNIVEMTLRSADGSIISKETYKYEIDDVGNWTKMTTSLIVFEDGQLRYEPVEATYRTITYYYDQTIAKMLDDRSSSASSTAPAASGSARPDSATAPKRLSASPTAPAVSRDSVGDSSLAASKRLEPEKTSDSPEGSRTESRAGSLDSQANQMEVALSVRGAAATNPRPPKVPEKGTESSTASHKAAFDFYKTGREQFDLGNLAGAIQAYQQSIKMEPGFAEVHLSLGHAYLRLNKTREAVKAFKESISLNPEMEEAHYGLGLEYFRMGNMKDATQAFKKAVRVRPDMAKAHYGLALAYQEMEKLDLLLEEYRILQTLDPGLAKKLSDTFPEFNLPCGGRRC